MIASQALLRTGRRLMRRGKAAGRSTGINRLSAATLECGRTGESS